MFSAFCKNKDVPLSRFESPSAVCRISEGAYKLKFEASPGSVNSAVLTPAPCRVHLSSAETQVRAGESAGEPPLWDARTMLGPHRKQLASAGMPAPSNNASHLYVRAYLLVL